MSEPLYSLGHHLRTRLHDRESGALRFPQQWVDSTTSNEDLATFALLSEAFVMLECSPSFAAMMLDYDETPINCPVIVTKHMPRKALGGFNVFAGAVCVSKKYLFGGGPAVIANALSHELRHAWQSQHKTMVISARDAAQMVRRKRMIEADAVAFSLTVAYECFKYGEPRLWQDWIKDHKNTNPECFKAFVNALKADPDAWLNGKAQNAAFLAWADSRHHSTNYGLWACDTHRSTQKGTREFQRYHAKNLPDDDGFNKALFDMPYKKWSTATGKSTTHPRQHYGRFLTIEWQKFNALTQARLRNVAKSVDTFARYRP